MKAKLPRDLVEVPKRKIKDLAIGEKADVPFQAVYVRPSGALYIDMDRVLEDPSTWTLKRLVQIERVRRGAFRLYLPSTLQEKVEVNKAGYLRLPWRWIVNIRPIVDVVTVVPNAEEAEAS